MEELKRCSACGSEAVKRSDRNDCKCSDATCRNAYWTPIDAWNYRPIEDTLIDALQHIADQEDLYNSLDSFMKKRPYNIAIRERAKRALDSIK